MPREDEVARRLMTIPGIGPITATAIVALAPPIETFAKGRDFAAWLGLAPRQHSTGGKQRLGAISKMGERTIRRLLIIGGSAVVLPGEPARRAGGLMAGADAGAQAAHAGHGRARQQDGAHRLGVADEERGLQSSGQRSRRKPRQRSEASEDVGGRRRVWHNSRRDGAGRTREWQSASQARYS